VRVLEPTVAESATEQNRVAVARFIVVVRLWYRAAVQGLTKVERVSQRFLYTCSPIRGPPLHGESFPALESTERGKPLH
jgi:hypothetical protein